MKKIIIFLWLLLGGLYYYLSQNYCKSSADASAIDGIVADTSSYESSYNLNPNSYMVSEDMLTGSYDFAHIKDSLLSTLSPSDTLTIYGMDGGTARAQAFVEKIGLDDDRIKIADNPIDSINSEETDMSVLERDSLNGIEENLQNGSNADSSDTTEKDKTDEGKLKMVCSCLRGNLNKVVLTISDTNRANAVKRARQYTDHLVLCGIPPSRIITVVKSKSITENSLETLIQK